MVKTGGMKKRTARAGRVKRGLGTGASSAPRVWTLEDARARFSEVIRLARDHGPQRVTVRGQDAAVVLSAAEYAKLVPAAPAVSLASLFADGPLARLDGFEDILVRESTPARDAPAFSK